MKKRRVKLLAALAILVSVVICIIIILKNPNPIAPYEGKWKVTKQLTEYFRSRTTYYSHHYLGRTVILGKNTVEESIGYWPEELGWWKEKYDLVEVKLFLRDDRWITGNVLLGFDEFIKEEKVPFIRYLNYSVLGGGDTYCGNYFIILDDTHLASQMGGGYYLLEPFQYCNPKVNFKDLSGNWEIAYLDSYENSYEGSYEDIESFREVGGDYGNRLMDALQGTDFSAEEWLGKSVSISEDKVTLYETDFFIETVKESRASREAFEREMGIHDGLSIYDEQINVCDVKCSNGEEFYFVPVDWDKAIMHLEEGWFMLTKKS